MLKHNFIIKYCIALALLLFIAITPQAQAKEEVPAELEMSQLLWQGITIDDLEVLKKITVEIEHKNYEKALSYVEQLKKDEEDLEIQEQSKSLKERPDFFEAVTNIILWHKYSGEIDPKGVYFNDISRFSMDNKFYPNYSQLRRNVEEVAIANNISYQSSEQYFNSSPAADTSSKIYVLKSKIDFLARSKDSQDKKTSLRNEIRILISEIWINENFSEKEEGEFLDNYQTQLTEIDHINRIDRLLWDKKIAASKRIMNFVNSDYQKLFKAIIAIYKSPRYIDKIILSVPRKLRSNEGLSYRRVMWYKSKNKVDDLLDVILDLPKKMQFPEKWWGLRHLYARELFKVKKYKISYKLLKNHGLPTNDSDFWEAEWMTGWVALRFLDKPKEARDRFENLYNNVRQPVSLARASYWLAMSYEAMGDKKQAIQWYKVAIEYPIFFYGQLAIHKHRLLDPIQAQNDIILPEDPHVTERDMAAISNSKAVQVAYLLMIMSDKPNAENVFKWVVTNAKTKGEVAVIMRLINEIGDRHLEAKTSLAAAKKNVFFIRDKFQIVDEIRDDEYAPLVHAIVKQESGFAPIAFSRVGAVGFMQLMPDTAKLVAKDIGIKYDKRRLSRDIKYNVRLGSFYIKKLIDRFDGSEMLAIASYNAGPNTAQRWINEFYDPREEEDIDKVVDWIELITYSETRNYVQRIMENLIVYKYLMSRNNYDSVK